MTAERPDTAVAEPVGGETVDPKEFRHLIGHFATGVTVVTTSDGGAVHGTTVSALTSVSLEPPTLLVCLNRTSLTGQAIANSGHFAVNILAEGQEAAAFHFARSGSDVAAFPTTPGRHGSPLLADALVSFECRVTNAVTAGTHSVVIGEVEAAAGTAGKPLAYFRGQFGRLVLEDE